jgi:plastocyanin
MGLVVAMAMMLACGDDSPTGPSGGGGAGGGSGSPGPSGATITIGANGAVSPQQVTIAVGQSVTFVNNHNAAHEMSSNPHPVHSDCPAMNAVGSLQPGQSRLTNAFTTARTCGFHDHINFTDGALMGTITIQ